MSNDITYTNGWDNKMGAWRCAAGIRKLISGRLVFAFSIAYANGDGVQLDETTVKHISFPITKNKKGE